MQRNLAIGLDSSTTDDPDRRPRLGAGPDIGDANLDSDTDASGTGEHATTGRDYPWQEAADISTDTVVDSPDEAIARDREEDVPTVPSSPRKRSRPRK